MKTRHSKSIGLRTLCAGIALLGSVGNAQLAKGANKFVGNITQNGSGSPPTQFTDLWNQATAENGCKWGSIEGTRGSFNWGACDVAYNWAKNNGRQFKFHALLWGSQYPSWLESLSADDTKKEITIWFDAVKKHFPDIQMIDVVNEAIRTGTNQYHSNYQKTKIREALGGDNNDYAFITTAFKMARERWPNTILIYNDYNTFQWQINEGITLVQTIKKNGAPVDAYGQQAHDLTDMDVTSFKAALKKIHDGVGIPLVVTEYDIGTDDDAKQKQRYQEQITEFMNADYVFGITLWGYIYGQTWTTNGNSGIIKNGSDRPAMAWLRTFLASSKGVNSTKFTPAYINGITSGVEARTATPTTAAKPGFVMRNLDGRMVMGVERDGKFMEMSALGRH